MGRSHAIIVLLAQARVTCHLHVLLNPPKISPQTRLFRADQSDNKSSLYDLTLCLPLNNLQQVLNKQALVISDNVSEAV